MHIFKKPALGIDISDHSIEAVFMTRRGGRLMVSSYGRITLPPGVVVDGFVERRDEARLAIRKLLADKMTPPLPKGIDRVISALPESQVYCRVFEVPRAADEAELGRSLEIEADGYFPYHHDEMVSSHVVIGQRPDRKDVYYAAVHSDTIKSYLDLFKASGLRLEAVEGESSAVARALLRPNETGPVMFVDVGARVTDISVFDRDGIQFSETLETAGDSFTRALVSAMGITFEDADVLKHGQGISSDLDDKARSALVDTADRLAVEIAGARDYYEGRYARKISRVVMCGGSMLMSGLFKHLSSKLSIASQDQRIELADPWQGLELNPVLEKLALRERGVLATTAVGLAMRGLGVRKFNEINLLSEKTRNQGSGYADGFSARDSKRAGDGKRRLPTWLKLAIAVVAVLLLTFGAWYAAFGLQRRSVETSEKGLSMPSEIRLEVEAEVGEAFSVQPPALPVTFIVVETETSVAVARPGEVKYGLGRGEIEIVNESSAPQTLIATTRLVAGDGTTFRLDERVTVPSRGRVAASMTADQPGPQGDAPPGVFSIPGLTPARQKSIYGVTSRPTSGGLTNTGAIFSDADLTSLRGLIEAEASKSLGELIASKTPDGMSSASDQFEIFDTRFVEVPVVGEPVGSFTARAVVSARAPSVNLNEAESLLLKDLATRAGIESYGLENIDFSLVEDGPKRSIILRAIAYLKP